VVHERANVEGMHRLGWGGSGAHHATSAGRRGAADGKMDLVQGIRIMLQRARLRNARSCLTNADMADSQRLPQTPLDAEHAARAGRDTGDQRERTTVVTDEIKVGDNTDTMGALAPTLVEADALRDLTDQAAVRRGSAQEPAGKVSGRRPNQTGLEAMAGGVRIGLAKGGMLTGPAREARRAQRRADRDRLGARGPKSGPPGARRGCRHAVPRRPCARGAQAEARSPCEVTGQVTLDAARQGAGRATARA